MQLQHWVASCCSRYKSPSRLAVHHHHLTSSSQKAVLGGRALKYCSSKKKALLPLTEIKTSDLECRMQVSLVSPGFNLWEATGGIRAEKCLYYKWDGHCIIFRTGPFTSLKPQYQEIGAIYIVQECRVTDFKAQKLWKGRSGSVNLAEAFPATRPEISQC